MDKSDKLVAINQALPGLECFLREVLGSEGLSSDAEVKRQEFLKRLENIATPPSLPPRPPLLPPRLHFRNDSGSRVSEDESNSLYRNDGSDDPVAFASRQRELSRHYTYSRGYVGRKDLFGEDSPIYSPQVPAPSSNYGQRDSIKSNSSDEIYERLSFNGEAVCLPESPITKVPEESTPPQDSSATSNLAVRGGVGRGSGGKGKITSGWFKKEAKIYDNIHLSDITDPVIQGYLKDVKSKQRRWCVLKDEKLYIFKTRDDPCTQIIDLPNCDIGVDDKKKISYSFSLRQSGGPAVQLAIEQGHDLSPWMSAIMAAAVRRSYRPISPQERAFSLDKPPSSPYGYMRINIPSNDHEDGGSSTYEVPVECFSDIFNKSGYQSTPIRSSNEPYNPPLPSLPVDSDSSSESSSDEDDMESPINTRKKREGNNVKRRSLLDEGTDSPSDHSTHGVCDIIASEEAKGEKGLRKRTSTALSNVSIDSVGSGPEMTATTHYPQRKLSVSNGPRTKRRRKTTSAESEAKFLQDPSANHSGVLFQKRPLGLWSKRYCKLKGNQLRCYRHADDVKPSLTIDLHDHDVSLIDSKESKKSYGFKVSHPTLESFCFATDSRVSVERWIELLSLAATGRQDIVAPYPPYFKSDSADELENAKSQDSLNFSEDALESGDATDFTSDPSRIDDDTSSFAADELDEDLSSDTREDSFRPKLNHRRVKSPQRRSPRYTKGGARERAMKRKNDKKRDDRSADESQDAVSMSPSQFVSDSGGESRPDSADTSNRIHSTDGKKDKPKGWAESLKLKQSRFTRGHSITALIAGSSPEASKNRLNNIKKTNMQSYSHLLSLFDKEGRFSGFLTEVKVSKYSRTQLRRWCVVKNGVLNLYNKQVTDEEPAVKLNLAEMWLSQNAEELKSKYNFELHDKDGRNFTFQVAQKEDFDKWLEVLRAFTEIRVERPSMASPVEHHDKTKLKEEGVSGNTFVKRPSIRMKFTQKVNVIDMFKRSQTYDFENPIIGELPSDEVKCINYTGGQLTEVCVTDDHYTWSRVRWCTIKDSELLIYQDNECDAPIKRIVLYNIRLEEACEPDKDIYKFKIHRLNDTTTLIANNKTDYERWVKQIQNASLSYGRHDHEDSKCRFPSPPRVFGHRRTRSESLQKFGGSATASDISSAASSPEKRLSQLSFGSDLVSTSSEGSTDTLMNGHLQEIVPNDTNGIRKWCTVTSEFLLVYDNDDQPTPSRKVVLQDWKVREENIESPVSKYGFSLHRGEERILFQSGNKEVAAQWLSVLQRYCGAKEDQLSPLVRCSKPTKSLSDDNLKSHLPNQERRSLRKTLSEGRASGRKLLRKISEDNLLHKYRRSELFKIPWKGSFEKVTPKLQDTMNFEKERRYSCGSLFDNDGKFSGYLVELVTRPLCRSEVRRWCVLSDDSLFIYDQPRMDTYRKQIPINNLELVNESNFIENKFVLKLRSEGVGSHVFKMSSRAEFEKWVAALSVKINVLKSRRERRRFVIDEEQFTEPDSSSTRYTLAPPTVQSVSSSVASDISNDGEVSVIRSLSNISSDSVFSRIQPLSAAGTESVQSIDDLTPTSPENDILKTFERMDLKEKEETSDDTLKSDSLIDLGSFKVPWSAVDDTFASLSKETEPVYQNIKETGPIYENVGTVGTPEGSSNTLSSMTVEQIDLNSREGKQQYRQFQKRALLSDGDESMFMDMLPKRSSEYELGTLYENVQFRKHSSETKEIPLWSARSSKDFEDVFFLNNHNSLKSFDEANLKDRRSFASDYSGIVGEALLDEVASCSTSRSDTLSSQTSIADHPDAAFDKELLSDILGLQVSAKEAVEISDFCSKCDQETEQERTVSYCRSSTLTNRQSEVFFDAFSEFNEMESKDEVPPSRGSVGSEEQNTYFGPSSSEDESFTDCQGYSTANSSPYHRRYSTGNTPEVYSTPDIHNRQDNLDPKDSDLSKESISDISIQTSKDSVSRIHQENSTSLNFLKPQGKTEAKDYSQSKESISHSPIQSFKDSESVDLLKNADHCIVSVGAVIEDKLFYCAQSSLDDIEKPDNSDVVVLRDKATSVPAPARQELTKSQTEFIKAVTDAFEGIIDLTLDEDEDGEDTKF